MSTAKKQALRRGQPITPDMIDQANMDIDFIGSFIDLLSIVSETEQLDAVMSSSILCMCSQSKIRIDAIKKLIRNISTCDDSLPETACKDMIREENAAYGRDSEIKPRWIMQERMMFLRLPDSGTPAIVDNSPPSPRSDL